MPAFEFTSPEGQKYTINGPDGATQEQAFEMLQKHLGSDAPAQTADEAMASPEGQKLAGELRSKADRQILEEAGAGPISTALSGFANAAFLNAPRNVAAGIRSVRDGKSFSDEYAFLKSVDEAAARERGATQAAGIGGAFAGAALIPVAPAATLAGRAAQGAALGGGLSGGAELLDTKDLEHAGKAALGGALIGGVAPPAIEGVVRGAGALGRGVSGQVRSLINTEGEAARRVADALNRDARVGGQQLDESALATAQTQGQPAVVADLGGEATRGLARSAANTSPEARTALSRVATDRFESQAPRVSEFVMGLGGGQDALSAREALQTAAAKANRPAYAKAFAQGERGSWHEGLAQLSQAPVVADAIKGATRTSANKAAAEGFRPVKNPFTVLESGEVTLTGDAKPTLQFWDAVKRNLDDKIGTLQRSGEKSAARDAIELRRQLVSYLDQDFPAYSDARAGAAKFFGAEDALDAGVKFVTAKGKNSEYARVIAKMSEPERKLFADGFASELSTKISETSDRRSVLNSIFNSSPARQRVEMALGKDKAKELEAFLNVESLMDGLREAVKGNSTTVRQLVEAGLAGGVAGALSTGDVSSGAILGAIARGGKIKIDQRLAKRVGEMLSSSDPEVFKRAVRMASKSNRLLDFIKAADTRLGAAFSGASENVGERLITITRPASPGQLPARADDENAGQIPTVRSQ